MFGSLNKLLFVILISTSLIFATSSVFAQNQNSNPEDYEKYLEKMRKNVNELEVRLEVITPKGPGYDNMGSASGFAIFEQKNQVEDVNRRIINYTTFYIYSLIHIISDEDWDLVDYQKHRVAIYVLGKNNAKIPAQVVAWGWIVEGLLLRVDISEQELDNFKIQVAKIASKAPISLEDSKYSGEDVSTIYFGGYPEGIGVVNPGYFRRYVYNLNTRYNVLAKVAFADIGGFSGPGQSGAAIFNRNLEVAGVCWGGPGYSGLNSAIVIPIDVIVEKFLKDLPELKGLKLPKFELEKLIKDKPVVICRPQNVTMSAKNNLNN